jgi:histidine ammonia-lyase
MMNSDTSYTRKADDDQQQVTFGAGPLCIEQVVALAEGRAVPTLNPDPAFRARIQRGADFLDRLLSEEGVIYGVTTGYGDSVTRAVPPALVAELPLHLTRFHGCGLGADLSLEAGRAVLATRLCSLTQGVSGVSQALLARLCWLLEQDLIPRIPEEGSVGASGDLTPLSYVAAVLVGERELYRDGQLASTADVYQELGVTPLRLRPKEGLALMNGTSVMTALACLAYARTDYLMKLATRITALVSVAMEGNAFHFDERLFAAKPHPGMQGIAAWLRRDLQSGELPRHSDRLQDRYSLRCAPHVIGVVADSLPWWRQLIENELNSANDNPLIDGDFEHVMHGGHFYGGHIAMAMDSMKTAVANLADLLDRQLAQLVDSKFNGGLPSNLSGACGERQMINHGFKAVQIGVSAWTAEALKLTMPASVFSRSTECHNQDKVSMGTIAARDALRVLTLSEQVGAACLLAAVQGVELRLGLQQLSLADLSPALREMVLTVRAHHAPLVEDRPLEQELRALIARLQARHYPLYGDKTHAE